MFVPSVPASCPWLSAAGWNFLHFDFGVALKRLPATGGSQNAEPARS
jgi:hypothetical protein